MKTLELKDLKHYLGTGLKLYYETVTLKPVIYDLTCDNITVSIHRNPIMLPLSALTEPIPDGSIPIVEIIKTQVNRNSGYSFNEVCDIEFHEKVDWSCGLDHFTLPCIWWKMNGYGYEIVLGKMCPMWITEYLYANHFWLGDQSLFETGEIIDKRTLKQTP